MKTIAITLTVLIAALFPGIAKEKELPSLLSEDFEQGASRWQPSDEKAWKISERKGGHAFDLTVKVSDYKPPHRSPHNIALLKDVLVGDFILTAKLKTTEESYGHRSMCLFFGYQNPAQFYYVHLGQKTDDHANQIFIVNKAARTKISSKTTPGTPWKENHWHDVKIVRDSSSGTIEIYFDDMKKPIMEASDKTFTWGQIGIGSFDDKGMFDDIELRGVKVAKPANP